MPASLDPAVRLLSPNRRRVYPNPKTGTLLPRATGAESAHSTLVQREGLRPGQADDITWDCLVALGWTEYRGQAQPNPLGYIIVLPDGSAMSDASVRPEPWPGPKKGRAD